MNGSREKILGCIREALKTAAHPPEPGGKPLPSPAPAPPQFRQWLPRVGESFEEQCQLFASNAAMLRAVFERVPSAAAAAEKINQIARAEQWKKIATHRHPLLDEVLQRVEVARLYTDNKYALEELEACPAAVTACEALVAQTGSVLVSSHACGGRAVSILPPHHLVVASASQMAPDLLSAFAIVRQKYEGHYPSMLSFITGPSRTGDIERILVLGAHGPKQLTIIMVG